MSLLKNIFDYFDGKISDDKNSIGYRVLDAGGEGNNSVTSFRKTVNAMISLNHKL